MICIFHNIFLLTHAGIYWKVSFIDFDRLLFYRQKLLYRFILISVDIIVQFGGVYAMIFLIRDPLFEVVLLGGKV